MAKLIFFCGKMAAGKSTLARALAARERAVVLNQDALCKRQLKERSKDLPPGTPWTSEAEFDMIMGHFLPPAEDEGFNVIRHHRDA